MLKPLNKRLNAAARQRRVERIAARNKFKQVTQEKDRMPNVINNVDDYTKWALGKSISPRKPDVVMEFPNGSKVLSVKEQEPYSGETFNPATLFGK